MVGVGRNLWRSSSPTPLLKQVYLEQGAQDHIQVGKTRSKLTLFKVTVTRDFKDTASPGSTEQ